MSHHHRLGHTPPPPRLNRYGSSTPGASTLGEVEQSPQDTVGRHSQTRGGGAGGGAVPVIGDVLNADRTYTARIIISPDV